MRTRAVVAGSSLFVSALAVLTGAAHALDIGDPGAPDPGHGSASVSASAGTLLPLTLSPRVNAERVAVAVTSGYDGGNASATFVTTADVRLAGPVGARVGFTYLPDVTGKVFQPHVGLRLQLLHQGQHGLDGAVAVFYRMERLTQDEGMVQLLWTMARRFNTLSLFANLAYGQDPEGDDRDGELRIAAQIAASSRLQLGVDGRIRVDLFSTDARRGMRGATNLDFAVGPLATLTVGRFAFVGHAGMSGVRASVLRTGVLATMGVASVF